MFNTTPMRSVASNGPMSTKQVNYQNPNTARITTKGTLDNMVMWANEKGGDNSPNAALAGKSAYDFGASSVNSGAQFQ